MSRSNYVTFISCLLLLMLRDDCLFIGKVEAILGSLRRGNRQCQKFTSKKIIQSTTNGVACECMGIPNLFFTVCKLNKEHCFNSDDSNICQNNIEYFGSYNTRQGYSQFVYNITEMLMTEKVVDNNKNTLIVKVQHNNDFRISDSFFGFGNQNDNLQFINCTAIIGNNICQSCTICDNDKPLQYQFDCTNIPLSSSSNDVIYTKQCIGL